MEKGGDGICTFSKYDNLSIVNSKEFVYLQCHVIMTFLRKARQVSIP